MVSWCFRQPEAVFVTSDGNRRVRCCSQNSGCPSGTHQGSHCVANGSLRLVLRLQPSLLQILLQVEDVSNLAPRQRYGSFQNALWQIYQREGFRASTEATAVVVQLYNNIANWLLALSRHTTEAMELMSFGFFLTQLSNLHCTTPSRSCLLRLMVGHWA